MERELGHGYRIVNRDGRNLLVKIRGKREKVLGEHKGWVGLDARMAAFGYATSPAHIYFLGDMPVMSHVKIGEPVTTLPPMMMYHYVALLPDNVKRDVERAFGKKKPNGIVQAPAGYPGELLTRNGRVLGSHLVTLSAKEAQNLHELVIGNERHFYLEENGDWPAARRQP